MAKRPLDSWYTIWGVICIFAILAGIGILPAQFVFRRIDILTFIDISLLIFGVGGIAIIRKKATALRQAHPEFFKALEALKNPKPTKCAICGAEPAFRFRCYYCQRYFCEEHKLPKNHHCSAAPPTSFRTVLMIGAIAIFIGISMLYVSFAVSLTRNSHFFMVIFGPFSIFFGTGTIVVRSWEERQSKRAMGLN